MNKTLRCLLGASLIASYAKTHAVDLEKVFESGEAAPGTNSTYFSGAQDTVLNDRGEVLFRALLNDKTIGVWLRGTTGTITDLGVFGGQAAALPTGVQYTSRVAGHVPGTVTFSNLGLNDTGTFWFSSRIRDTNSGSPNVSSANEFATWVGNATTVQVLNRGYLDSYNQGSGIVLEKITDINKSGKIVHLFGPSSTTLRVLYGTASNLQNSLSLVHATTIPGTTDTIRNNGARSIGFFQGYPFLDATDKINMPIVTQFSGVALIRGNTSGYTTIIKAGSPVVGYPSGSTCSSVSAVIYGMDGRIVVAANINIPGGSTAHDFLICQPGSSTFQSFIKVGDVAPLLNGITVTGIGDVKLSDTSPLALTASLSDGGRAIYFGNESSLMLAARTNTVAPGVGGAVFSGFIGGTFINNSATLVQSAQISGESITTNVNSNVVYAFSTNGKSSVLFRQNQVVDTGSANKTISSFSLNDFNNQNQLLAKITFTDGASGQYLISVPRTNLEFWRSNHFGSIRNSGSAADSADPDGDGIANLLEYALGLTPTAASTSGLPLLGTTSDGRLTLTFQRDPSLSELTYTVEATYDLDGSWTAIARSVGGAVISNLGGLSEVIETGTPLKTVTVYDLSTLASHPKRFLRLRVSR